MRKKILNQPAFTMIELVFVVMIIGVMSLGLYKMVKNFTEDEEYREERFFLQTVETGIKSSFLDIIDGYEGGVTNSVVDSSSNWGWETTLSSTSPLPVSSVGVGGLNYIDYKLQTGILTATEYSVLQAKIVSNFRGSCSLDGSSGVGTLRLFCPRLSSLRYDFGATLGAVTPHVLGNPLNPFDVPVVHVNYISTEITTKGAPRVSRVYDFSLNDVYQAKRNLSIRKIKTIRTAMESFVNATLSRELSNARRVDGSGGLNSGDDVFVPWVWKIFGDNSSQVRTTMCVKPAGAITSCTNMNSNNIWRSSVGQKGIYSRRVVNNLLGGDRGFLVDGFNNPIFIYPLASSCSTLDYSLCPIVAPSLPTDNYLTLGNPPFVSVIYTPSFSSKNVSIEDYGRVLVAY